MAIEKSSDVSNAAVSEFERFVGSVESPLTFVERSESNEHGLLDSSGVERRHDGLLARENQLPELPSLPTCFRAKNAKWDS